jgi:putative membrane protein
MMRGFGGFGGFGWIGSIIGLVIMIAIVVALIMLTIYAIRGLTRSRSGQNVIPQGPAGVPPLQTPKEILQARYARGEITREQYLAMLEDLK